MRRAVRGRARGRKAALVEMRREPEARRVAQRVERAALFVLERLQLTELEQRACRRVRRRAAGDRAVRADVDAALDEKRSAAAVRDRGAGERLLNVDRVVGGYAVELGEGRKARRSGRRHELIDVEAADRRDPLALGELAGRGLERLEHGADRVGVLEPRVVAGAQAEQHDVVVVVDDARDRRAPAEVDRPRALGRRRLAADRREALADDVHGRDDGIVVVHRMNAAVDQQQIGFGADRLRLHAGGRAASERGGEQGAEPAEQRGPHTGFGGDR